jgi:hypothetical protein
MCVFPETHTNFFCRELEIIVQFRVLQQRQAKASVLVFTSLAFRPVHERFGKWVCILTIYYIPSLLAACAAGCQGI